MVVDGAQVSEVLLGSGGVIEGAAEGLVCIDMSTIAPGQAREIGTRLAERGIGFVDAPVTGSTPKATDGTLTIMAGGSDEDLARAMPMFEAMGEVILHVGPLGHGQTIKVISNSVSAANANALAQALIVGSALGIDLDALSEVMRTGSAGSTMLTLKGEPMRRARLHPALPARAHAQGRAPLHRGGAGRRRPVPRRRCRARGADRGHGTRPRGRRLRRRSSRLAGGPGRATFMKALGIFGDLM